MEEYKPLPPFKAVSGAKNPKIVLIGEAWGQHEAEIHLPFAGESGKELWRMLGQALPDVYPELWAKAAKLLKYGQAWVRVRDEWLSAAGIAITNSLSLWSNNNKLETLCCNKKEAEVLSGGKYPYSAITKGKYLQPMYFPELERLEEELKVWNPNLVVPLGNTSLWALTGMTNIGSVRGAVVEGHVGSWKGKILPTYHPAGVLRNWSWRPIVLMDLMKAYKEGKTREIHRPKREILISPTLAEIRKWLEDLYKSPPKRLSCDIETAFGQITVIGFARDKSHAIVIPFVCESKPGWNYWNTPEEEREAWDLVEKILNFPCPILGQNFVYDLQYILKMGLTANTNNPSGWNCTEDTMLLHHSIFPEMQKGLGFLGSVYTNEASWKLMRRRKGDTEMKSDE